jgi:hypothetical protein
MASRQVTEGWQHQLFAVRATASPIAPSPIGEAGQPQPVGPMAHQRHRMQMAAKIEKVWPGFGPMAEPKGAEGTGGFPPQALQPAAPFVVAIDQPQRAIQKFGKGRQFLPQFNGDAHPTMDQITEHHHLGRPEALGELQQGIEVGGISIAGQGHAMGLEQLGFAEMEIRHQQRALLRIPHSPLSQQIEAVTPPDPGLLAGADAQTTPIAFW